MATHDSGAPGAENSDPVSGGTGAVVRGRDSGGSEALGGVGVSAPGRSSGGPAAAESVAGSSETVAAAGEARRVTPTEIAKDWGTSRAYASKKVKEGCPTDSLEAARKWRLENSRYGIGYRSKGAVATNESAPAEGIRREEETEKWGIPQQGVNERGRGSGGAGGGAVIGVRDLSNIEASLQAAIEVEQEALRLVLEAQRARTDAILAVRIAAYSKAQGNRLEAEERVQKYLTAQQVLVNFAEAKAEARRGYDVIIPQLRALAKNAGPLCNPENPLRATNILAQQIEGIIAHAAREYSEGGAERRGASPTLGKDAPRREPADARGKGSIHVEGDVSHGEAQV